MVTNQMGVLHCLGLNKEFKGVFKGVEISEAINAMKADSQDFSEIIQFLEFSDESRAEIDLQVQNQLLHMGKLQIPKFDFIYEQRLKELSATDRKVLTRSARIEQSILRTILLKEAEDEKCALCDKLLPTPLIVAAHIKPRSECSLIERKDMNVVMPVCKIGCDDLFEKGFIWVSDAGVIETGKQYTPDLDKFLESYNRKNCGHFREENKGYFEYRRNLNNKQFQLFSSSPKG